MRISQFDYDLPEELIAQHPLEQRDASRMLVLNRANRTTSDSTFAAFPEYLKAGDIVVLNNTRVFRARLIGRREPTGGRVETLLVREVEPRCWQALVRPGNRVKVGDYLSFGNSRLRARVTESLDKGLKVLCFDDQMNLSSVLNELGETPLPPYIKRPTGNTVVDDERYQTVYARNQGAIAAPTAGLHFTSQMIETLQTRGAHVAEITLHVGYGTFEPVRVEEIEQHSVAPESFEITSATAAKINDARAGGGRLVAIGTTTTRALESMVNDEGVIRAGEGETSLTITPGFKFRAVDALLTNFHLPRSSLLLLVSSFAGRDFTLEAYRHAVHARYRFYSYGDCMFVI